MPRLQMWQLASLEHSIKMKLLALAVLLFCALSIAMSQGVVRVQSPTASASPTPTPGTAYILTQTLGTLRNNFSGCVGMHIAATANNTVNALGRWKVAGNSGTHLLVLVQDTGGGAGTILQSCSVNLTTGSAASYVYCSITPQAITNGTQYYILSEEVSSGDQWYDNDTSATSKTAGIGTIQDAAGATGGGCVSGFFDSGAGTDKLYVPTNFKVQ